MGIWRILTLAALGLASCATAAEQAEGRDDTLARTIAATVDPLIEAERRRSGMPGAAFIFVRDGRVVYRRGYGFADRERGERADPCRTVWPIASITKIVTALVALQLVEEGRIQLDGDVNRHLRRLEVPSQGYGPLTLRHLLSHTPGLDELPGRQFDGAQPPDAPAFLRQKIRRYRPPGAATAYSSYGIMLAGLMIEDVTGVGYADQVRRRVLEPLGMSRSRFMMLREDEAGVATPYVLDDGVARRTPHEFYVSVPSSSMVATAEDMGRLLLALLGEHPAGEAVVLRPTLLQAMTTQQSTLHPALPGWGLGFQLDSVNGRRIAEHGGDIGGFSALLVLLPDEDAGFFIVNHGEGSDLRFQVRQALLDRLWPAPPAAVPVPDPAAAGSLAEYAGRYLSSAACRSCAVEDQPVFELEAAPDGTLSFWGRRWVPLGGDLFLRDDGRRLLGFARDANGRIAAVTGGSWRVAERLPD